MSNKTMLFAAGLLVLLSILSLTKAINSNRIIKENNVSQSFIESSYKDNPSFTVEEISKKAKEEYDDLQIVIRNAKRSFKIWSFLFVISLLGGVFIYNKRELKIKNH